MEAGTESSTAHFDDHSREWFEWESSPWGAIAHDLRISTVLDAMANPDAPAGRRALDLGGGSGLDAVALARAGYDVTVVDSSAAMLEQARARARDSGLEDKVVCLVGDVTEFVEGQPDEFSLVLCHNVVQYLRDAGELISAVPPLLEAGGMLSLVAPNPAAEVLAAVTRRLNPAEALFLLDAPSSTIYPFETRAFRRGSESLQDLLEASGLVVTKACGGPCVADLVLPDKAFGSRGFTLDLLRLERRLYQISPYRDVGRFVHVLATHRRSSKKALDGASAC